MIVLEGRLIGDWDPGGITPACAPNVRTNLPGSMMEPHNQRAGKTNGRAHGHGRVAAFMPWAVIMWSFESAVDAGRSNPSPPGFVCAAEPTPLDSCRLLLAVNGVLQYKKIGQSEGFLFGNAPVSSWACQPRRWCAGRSAPARRPL